VRCPRPSNHPRETSPDPNPGPGAFPVPDQKGTDYAFKEYRGPQGPGNHLIFLLCGIVAVGFVLVISVYLIISGLPAIRQIGLFKFLFGQVWDPANTTTGAQYGILPFILTSIYGTAGAMVIGVPIGLMTAIFLSKLAPP